MKNREQVWLDADPGHDDAIALLFALYMPQIRLFGVSTVHGNGSVEHTTSNAARLLTAFVDSRTDYLPINFARGAAKPLLRPARHDTEIHGADGLGGVEGLPPATHWRVRNHIDIAHENCAVPNIVKSLERLGPSERMTIVATGTLTNIALLVATYPDLVRDTVDQIVLMGGAARVPGNRSPTAEFNILCDPEAAAIVFDAEVKVVMIPLDVTHTALFTPLQNDRLLQRTDDSPFSTNARTQLRHTLSTLLHFFSETYERVFGFHQGPPVHDPLCLLYVAFPEAFQGERYRVNVEHKSDLTAGTTSVDWWNYREAELVDWKADPTSPASWGARGKNVWVASHVNVNKFWDVFHDCVDAADKVCRLNDPRGF